MSETAGIRASDAERDRAADLLGEHFAAGRLDADELHERLDAVHAARTRTEIDVLFTDLPRPSLPKAEELRVSRAAVPWGIRAVELVAVAVLVGAAVVLVTQGWWPVLFVIGVIARRGCRAGYLGPGRHAS